jgi:two-component system response regulator (stage 0 sporulation protein A)
MRSLTGELYPMVARRFRVSSLNLEHAMRRAIESAWSGSAMERQHALFGNTIDARRGKPTAGEMIGRLAELARVKEL